MLLNPDDDQLNDDDDEDVDDDRKSLLSQEQHTELYMLYELYGIYFHCKRLMAGQYCCDLFNNIFD